MLRKNGEFSVVILVNEIKAYMSIPMKNLREYSSKLDAHLMCQ